MKKCTGYGMQYRCVSRDGGTEEWANINEEDYGTEDFSNLTSVLTDLIYWTSPSIDAIKVAQPAFRINCGEYAPKQFFDEKHFQCWDASDDKWKYCWGNGMNYRCISRDGGTEEWANINENDGTVDHS